MLAVFFVVASWMGSWIARSFPGIARGFKWTARLLFLDLIVVVVCIVVFLVVRWIARGFPWIARGLKWVAHSFNSDITWLSLLAVIPLVAVGYTVLFLVVSWIARGLSSDITRFSFPRGTPEKRPMRDTSKPANGIRQD